MTIPGIEQRCARCGVQIDDLAAHQERCFVVGDWVRWEYRSHWSEGELRCHMPDGVADVRVATSSQYRDVGKMTSMLVCNLRRIPRPGQEVPLDHYCRGCGLECAWSVISDGVYCNPCRAKSGLPALPRKHGPGGRGVAGPCDPDCAKCAVERANTERVVHLAAPISKATEPLEMPIHIDSDPSRPARSVKAPATSVTSDRFPLPQPPTPTLYDGRTAESCLTRWSDNRSIVERGGLPLYDLTPVQIAEAKRQYALVAHVTWSRILRAKVAASRSAERHQVVLDDDEALLAGYRSVE